MMSPSGQTLHGWLSPSPNPSPLWPETDLIRRLIRWQMLLALCNQPRSMAMQDEVNATPKPRRVPWNKGKLTGAKPPLRPKHVWSIRTKLQIEGRARDLAMFNLAIDSKLRGCDVVAIRVEDVAAGRYAADRATVRQKKTGRAANFK